eukprot:TRINITY_DN3359_c0_g2_i1.p1 TRINITY_DN3359_c0_g2~~TRINITY_DN3359_c0_g2_i1.p1  ORF type:complete len:528 (-),score=118.66 TRINITY_DN3359_c0_g2_i1:48-1589(-)
MEGESNELITEEVTTITTTTTTTTSTTIQEESIPLEQVLEGEQPIDPNTTQTIDNASTNYTYYYTPDFTTPPQLVCYSDEFDEVNAEGSSSSSKKIIRGTNFLKGSKFSPDGTCLLSCSEDNSLRLFEIDQSMVYNENAHPTNLKSVLKVSEAGTIYDYCWYPKMSSQDSSSSFFVSTSRSSPVHMWDAFNGKLKGSYLPYLHADEFCYVYSMCFDLQGEKLYCGGENRVIVFQTSDPSSNFQVIKTGAKKRKTTKAWDNFTGQLGIISSISFSPDYSGMFACGCYNKTVGLYDSKNNNTIAILSDAQSTMGGVTQVHWGKDGKYLFAGARKSNEILVWDVRADLENVVARLQRPLSSNQRLYFDIDPTGNYLVTGDQEGNIWVYDIYNDLGKLVAHIPQFQDTINGVSFHPTLPILSLSTGQRKYPNKYIDNDEDFKKDKKDENSNNYNNNNDNLITNANTIQIFKYNQTINYIPTQTETQTTVTTTEITSTMIETEIQSAYIIDNSNLDPS